MVPVESHEANPQSRLKMYRKHIDTCQPVHLVEFSPFESSSSLLCYATESKLSLLKQEEDTFSSTDSSSFSFLMDIHVPTRVDCLSWSPSTSLYPSVQLDVCYGGADFKLRLLRAGFDLNGEQFANCEVFCGHTNYVTGLAFHPTNPSYICSISEDCRCILWDACVSEQQSVYKLKSSGVSCCWNQHSPNLLMVAERCGVIRFYDIRTDAPAFSISSNSSSSFLMDADWSLDGKTVGAVSENSWLIWDLLKFEQPPRTGSVPLKASKFRWSHCSPHLFSVAAPTDYVKMYHTGRVHVPTSHYEAGPIGGLSWHSQKPLLVTGGVSRLNFWETDL